MASPILCVQVHQRPHEEGEEQERGHRHHQVPRHVGGHHDRIEYQRGAEDLDRDHGDEDVDAVLLTDGEPAAQREDRRLGDSVRARLVAGADRVDRQDDERQSDRHQRDGKRMKEDREQFGHDPLGRVEPHSGRERCEERSSGTQWMPPGG